MRFAGRGGIRPDADAGPGDQALPGLPAPPAGDPESTVEQARALDLKLLPHPGRAGGAWLGLRIDPETGEYQASSPRHNGCALAY